MYGSLASDILDILDSGTTADPDRIARLLTDDEPTRRRIVASVRREARARRARLATAARQTRDERTHGSFDPEAERMIVEYWHGIPYYTDANAER